MKQLKTLLIAGLTASCVIAQAGLLANFDGHKEGDAYNLLLTGGIRFHDVITHEGGATYFAIEDASSGFLGSGLSSPNVLGFGGYVPGPQMAFGCIGSFWFTSDTLATTAGLDVWVFQGETGLNTLTLRGYRDSQILNTVEFSFDFSAFPIHRRLDLPASLYDSFELFSSGPAHMGDSCIDVDNVTIEAVPEPGTVFAIAVGLAGLVGRKRVGSA